MGRPQSAFTASAVADAFPRSIRPSVIHSTSWHADPALGWSCSCACTPCSAASQSVSPVGRLSRMVWRSRSGLPSSYAVQPTAGWKAELKNAAPQLTVRSSPSAPSSARLPPRMSARATSGSEPRPVAPPELSEPELSTR
ncbi:hypothetical protein CMsap09_01785 [Clavibacter michiganensis]|uniref:Uncharacterized protein n=1 Tax=Clavibacter michiganensis TaxID=28447 RepID=A0A251XQ55_9MICO|nr:hypothetical protein CMsap09_01785 [Clavibacter michiganensis]